MIDGLDKLLRTTLTFAKEVAGGQITEEGIIAVERRLSANVLDVLNMADQARLEGRRGATNSAAAIEAAFTIVRIAYRFEIIARARIGASPDLQSKNILERQATFEQACCAALEFHLAKLGPSDSLGPLAQSSPTPTIDLASLSGEFAATWGTQFSPGDRILMATALETYRRLPILLLNLDASLSRIATF